MATTTHDTITDRRLEPRRLLPRRTADPRLDERDDPRHAYLEWLRMEARILQLELYPEMDPTRDFTPCNTFARGFHFPTGGDWRKVPKPSTRAVKVLAAVGVMA
jgi:hypothetical protein